MSYDLNPYYSPEGLGLRIVAEVEFSDLNYCFDTRVVWLHKDTGVYYTARDSGCSCPWPFEDYCSLELLDRVDWNALRAEVDARDPHWDYLTNADATRYKRRLRDLERRAQA